MSALIIPCYIKTQWDIDCLNRLFDSVQAQTKQFDKVYLIGPAKARNVGIDKAPALNIQHLLFTDMD